MFKNPLLQRYRFSQLRPRQIGIYGFIYVAIVSMIVLMNYTVFTTLRAFIFGDFELPFTIWQAMFYQFLGLQVIILWVWASYNSGTALTKEILNKSYIFFKLLPITPLQKALGVLIGTNLIAYTFGLLNVGILAVLAYFAEIRLLWVVYDLLTILAVAAFLNTMTLLLSINPDARNHRRIGTLMIIGGGIWAIMTVMGILLASGRMRTNFPEEIQVKFFSIALPGMVLFALMLFYFSGWVLVGILRKFQHERESLFTLPGSAIFMVAFEILTIGIFWPNLSLKSAFYGQRILCFWALVLVNLGTLRQLGAYFEHCRKIQERSANSIVGLIRFFRHTTIFWGMCLYAVWGAALFIIARIPRLPVNDLLFPLLNLFGFYLVALVLLELFVLFRHVHASVKIFLIFLGLVTILLPIVLFRFLENEQLYLHSVIGYMANLVTPFLVRGGNAAVQWRVFWVNLLICAVPLFLIVNRYRRFFTLRKNM